MYIYIYLSIYLYTIYTPRPWHLPTGVRGGGGRAGGCGGTPLHPIKQVPKMIVGRSQTCLNTIPQRSQNDPQTTPKRPPSHPKTTLKIHQNEPRSTPKSIPKPTFFQVKLWQNNNPREAGIEPGPSALPPTSRAPNHHAAPPNH